ncbi:MAG: S-layer homology domain-containing protein [Flavonifractor plautii]
MRYADTGEPVPLTSDYQQGWLFATVPAEEAERTLEVFQGEEHRFPDCITVWKGHEYYNDPGGAKELYLRGVLQGDHAGNLNPDAALTRAEAFAPDLPPAVPGARRRPRLRRRGARRLVL